PRRKARRHGRRWHQRRARSGRSRRRYRHELGHGCRHRSGRSDPDARRSARCPHCYRALASDHPDHQGKPRLGVRLQPRAGAPRGGSAVSNLGYPALPGPGRSRHGAVVSVGGCQQSPTEAIPASPSMITSRFLVGRDRYERATEGWADATHEDAFTHTLTIADDDLSIELQAVCTPSPGYEIREAEARILAGHPDAEIVDRLSQLAGARMVAGFTGRLVDLSGRGSVAQLFVDAGIEIARLARQVARLPTETMAGFQQGDALRCWQLDTSGWVDLPDSCFTYSAAGRALLRTRPGFTPLVAGLYRSPGGGGGGFVRGER